MSLREVEFFAGWRGSRPQTHTEQHISIEGRVIFARGQGVRPLLPYAAGLHADPELPPSGVGESGAFSQLGRQPRGAIVGGSPCYTTSEICYRVAARSGLLDLCCHPP